MGYEVLVDFDDNNSDVVTSRIYFAALDKYDGIGVGHSNGKSSVFLPCADRFTLEEFKKDLGDIRVLGVWKR